MTDPKTNTSTPLAIFLNIFGLSSFECIFHKIYNYAKNNPKTFTAIYSVISGILFFYLKALVYCFQAGRYFSYNINYQYIEVNNGIFYLAIEFMAVLCLTLLSNLLFLSICIDEKKKKIIRMFTCLFVEFILLWWIVVCLTDCRLVDLLKALSAASFADNITLILSIILLIIFINWGALFCIINLSAERISPKTNSDNPSVKSFNIIRYIALFLITCSFLAIITYICGSRYEANRVNYKIIQENYTSSTDILNSKDNAYTYTTTDNTKVLLYAVILETKDNYIMCPINCEDNKYTINKSQSKIIQKYNIITYQCEDITDLPSYLE